MHVEDIITLANSRQKARQINQKHTRNNRLALCYKVMFWVFIAMGALSFVLAIFSCIKYNDCENGLWPAFGPFIQIIVSIFALGGQYWYRIEWGEPEDGYSVFWLYVQIAVFVGCLCLLISQVLCV